jgi:hypothetical protein
MSATKELNHDTIEAGMREPQFCDCQERTIQSLKESLANQKALIGEVVVVHASDKSSSGCPTIPFFFTHKKPVGKNRTKEVDSVLLIEQLFCPFCGKEHPTKKQTTGPVKAEN